MNAGVAIAKIQEKHRNGLLGLWAFERLTNALARFGLTLHVSVIYREGAGLANVPEPRLKDCTATFADPGELAEVTRVEAYPISQADLAERMASEAECFVLRHENRIIALTWLRFNDPPRRLGLRFGPQDAYLFDAHTAPSWRGFNLLPYLRHALYRNLMTRGYTNLLSSSAAFNRPAHRFKQKLGAQPLEARLYLRLFGRFERIVTLYRFSRG